MCNPDILAVAKSAGRDFIGDQSNGARAECARPDECAIRREGRRGLRAGSESARVAYGAICQQSDWDPTGEAGCQSDDGKITMRTRIHKRNRTETFLRERSSVSISAVRGFGHF